MINRNLITKFYIKYALAHDEHFASKEDQKKWHKIWSDKLKFIKSYGPEKLAIKRKELSDRIQASTDSKEIEKLSLELQNLPDPEMYYKYLERVKKYKEKCKNDPDCVALQQQKSNQRLTDFYQRQRENPNSDFFKKRNEYKKENYNALIGSDTLDSYAYLLIKRMQNTKGSYVAEYKKKIVSWASKNDLDFYEKIKNKDPEATIKIKGLIEKEPKYLAIVKDESEIKSLAYKIEEFAKSLQLREPGKPLRPESAKQLIYIKDAVDSFKNQYGGKYRSVSEVLDKLSNKLKTIAAGMMLWK